MILASDTECLQLTCQAVGVTSCYWEKQDGNIPSGTPGLNTCTLTLVNLKPEYSGNYRCAVNCFGEKIFSNYATITLYCKLTVVVLPTIMECWSQTLIIFL